MTWDTPHETSRGFVTNKILDQLVRNTRLLPDSLSAAILATKMPPVEDVVMALLIGVMDAHAVVTGDPRSTINEKRLARMALAVALLAGMNLSVATKRDS